MELGFGQGDGAQGLRGLLLPVQSGAERAWEAAVLGENLHRPLDSCVAQIPPWAPVSYTTGETCQAWLSSRSY